MIGNHFEFDVNNWHLKICILRDCYRVVSHDLNFHSVNSMHARYYKKQTGQTCAGIAKYAWGRWKEELNKSSVAVRFISSVNSMDPPRCLREESILICECKYYNRMHLPCRHGLAICMELARSDLETISNWLRFNSYSCPISYMIINATSTRSRIPEAKTNEDHPWDKTAEKYKINADRTVSSSFNFPATRYDDYQEPAKTMQENRFCTYSNLISSFREIAEVAAYSSNALLLNGIPEKFIDSLNGAFRPEILGRKVEEGQSELLLEKLLKVVSEVSIYGIDKQHRNEIEYVESEILPKSNPKGTCADNLKLIKNPQKRKMLKGLPKSLNYLKSRPSRRRRARNSRRASFMFRSSALHGLQHKQLVGKSRAKVFQSQEVNATANK